MTVKTVLPSPERARLLDELGRQYEILEREKWQRIVLTSFAYALCALFADPRVMAAFIVVDIAAELLSVRLLRGLDPVATPGRYRASILTVVVMELAIATAAGLVWLEDDPYAKALGAGLAMTTLLQLSTVRSIHLPFGLTGLLTVAVVITGFNLAHWIDQDNMVGLALSLAAAFGGMAYALTAMRSNHGLHRASAEGAAAARASDAAKSMFLAQMSHELRTPLNAIIGLGLAEARVATGPSQERLRTIVASARGLAVVLDDVLDLSAITAGRVSITPEPTDLRLALKATVAVFAPEAEQAGGRLTLFLHPDIPPHVLLDAQRLRQCLANLLSNALKHAQSSAVEVSARHDNGQLIIDVADNGRGVPAQISQTLFEPFQRGTTTTPGLGLGLAISQSLARQMGGDLSHDHAEPGARFRLVVAAPVTLPPPERATVDLTGRCILVVDDIATNRLVASSLVQALGAKVVEADGGPEALRLIASGGIDLVLLDMAMPGMDGFETFHLLRAGPEPSVPVVAMTAAAMADQRAAILTAGLDGFVAKPLLPEQLAAVLGPLLPALKA